MSSRRRISSSSSSCCSMQQLFSSSLLLVLALLVIEIPDAEAWLPSSTQRTSSGSTQTTVSSYRGVNRLPVRKQVPLCSSKNNNSEGGDGKNGENEGRKSERTSFEQAGASIRDEEDRARLEGMGDGDINPQYQAEKMAKLRAAIQARTADLGMEKSTVSAEYIKERAEKAAQAGVPPGQAGGGEFFGGLDLSKISYETAKSKSDWTEDQPTMLYDPAKELSEEEQQEADPTMKLSIIEQGTTELRGANFPNVLGALREVVIMLVGAAISCIAILKWDGLVRDTYKSFGLVPTAEDIQNYASRFDGLDLPEGWTNNMNQKDVEMYGDKINAKSSSPSINALLESTTTTTTTTKPSADLTDSPSQFQ